MGDLKAQARNTKDSRTAGQATMDARIIRLEVCPREVCFGLHKRASSQAPVLISLFYSTNLPYQLCHKERFRPARLPFITAPRNRCTTASIVRTGESRGITVLNVEN